MSVEEKNKKAKAERVIWTKRFGAWRILWIYGWGILTGLSWAYAILNAPQLLESKTIVIVNQAEAKESEKKEESKEVTHSVDRVTEIAEMIYNLESGRGKNNYSKCEAIGKINGIGYGISGNGKYQCFESHEDEMQVLKGWIIDKQAKGMSENELLCLYSGNNYKNCK